MATTTSTTTTTKSPAPAPAAPAPAAPAPRGRRERAGLKRLQFQVPAKTPLPVRALWRAASEEERMAAHKTAVAVLSTWLGKMRREEAARTLGLTPIRFWQLSQQAVSGLVAGCLKQPRFRGRVPAGGFYAHEGVGAMRLKIKGLERELEGARRLIEVLKELPGNRASGRATGQGTGHGRGREAGAARAAPEAQRGAAAVAGEGAGDGRRA